MRERLLPVVVGLICVAFLHAQAPSPAAPRARVAIRTIRFQDSPHLLATQRRDLIREIQQDTDWPAMGALHFLSESVRQRVKDAYADNGYLRAKIEVAVVPQRLLDSAQQADVTIRALDEGRQYRLREVSWMGASAFPESVIFHLLTLRPGDIVSRVKVKEGMEAVRTLYASHGYLNYTAAPEIDFDDARAEASLKIDVDEGGVFTFEKFDIVGVNLAARSRLLEAWPLRPGDVYRADTLEEFMRGHAALLPPARQRDVVCRTLDLSNHTIEFVLDYRSQPASCAPPPEEEITHQTLIPAVPNR